MNSSDQSAEQDDASRTNQEASSSSTSSAGQLLTNEVPSTSSDIREDVMKRAAAKKLIERYFYQLTDGCGNPTCRNAFCASSGQLNPLTPDEAAIQAIKLFSEDATLCERHPNKIARTHQHQEEEKVEVEDRGPPSIVGDTGGSTSPPSITTATATTTTNNKMLPEESSNSSNETLSWKSIGNSASSQQQQQQQQQIPTNDVVLTETPAHSFHKNNSTMCAADDTNYLTEQMLYDIIDECETTESYLTLIRKLGEVFSSIENLSRSFLQTEKTSSSVKSNFDGERSGHMKGLKKEDVRSLEDEKDKDEDTSGESSSSNSGGRLRPVDLASVRRAYTALFKLKTSIFENSLVNALVTLAGNLQMELPLRREKGNQDDIINVMLIVFEIPALGSGDFLETALPAICRASEWLSIEMQAKLAKIWSTHGRSNLRNILENLQQLVTLRVIVTPFHRDFFVQDENVITSATKLMKIIYFANMLAGVLESPDLRNEDLTLSMDDSYLAIKLNKTTPPVDPLAAELGIHVLDCRKPYLPFSEFYNEPLSDAVEMDRDFANYKSELGKFCFMHYPFILTPATKMMGLYFDNRIRMYSERRISMLQTVTGQPSNPYLRLKVRRDHIIDDALVELEMISMENPNDLKKQLVVEFEGEQGIDEGGVSKEFFQLVIEEIFNPDYAMFTSQSESGTVWFNPTSFESDAQFSLIGTLLGLAIYNNVILAVNFPMVLYRKLMGKRGSFEDLQDWNPTLYNSLKELLEYNEPDVEEVFMQTFRISYQDVFGSIINYDLKEEGDEVSVTQENKYEFVDLYADFLINKSVEKQFRAFYKGFQMVVDESPLELLFRPEEIEALICGSKHFDFDELESSTEYDGGYTNESQIIKDFWSIVHALSLEEKRKLLQFTTGSDRVPIGGLSRLKLIIARNGPDSDRLPTAHTCFNVLLMPEYSTKEKLKDRLIKAISYSKGFGML